MADTGYIETTKGDFYTDGQKYYEYKTDSSDMLWIPFSKGKFVEIDEDELGGYIIPEADKNDICVNTDKKYCSNCGCDIDTDDNFCSGCGTEIKQED